MVDVLTIISVAGGAYIATNLDNLTLLVTLQARFRAHTWAVSGGFMASNLLLGALGFWIGTAANNAPVGYLGYLGFIPMSLGFIGVVKLFRGQSGAGTVRNEVSDAAGAVFVATLITQLSNGTDTVLTFAALFADSTVATDIVIVLTIAGMAAIFLLIATWGVRHPALSQWIERNAPRLTPWILIFVGAYIVANTATDVLPDS